MFDSLGSLTWFFGASAKRKAILQRYLKSEDISGIVTDDSLPEEERELADKLVQESRQKQVSKLCEARWSACVTTLSSVIAKYKAIVLALKDIASESSNMDTRSNALSYVRLLQAPSFIVALVVALFVLSLTKPLCLSLQKEDTDVVKAYENAKHCRTTIQAQ